MLIFEHTNNKNNAYIKEGQGVDGISCGGNIKQRGGGFKKKSFKKTKTTQPNKNIASSLSPDNRIYLQTLGFKLTNQR